jgi:HlyD family secretion protein
MKKTIILLLLAGIVGGLGFWYWRSAMNHAVSFRKIPVKRGDLAASISATGTLEPEEVVDIGAQVAGQIQSFGRDPRDSSKLIDYGSPVEQGTVLAQIDDSLYASDVDQAQASLAQAQANEKRAEADLIQMKAKLFQAGRDWTRAKQLGPGDALAASDYDGFQAAYKTAESTVGVGEASILQAKKAVSQAEAALKRAEINLGYCTIKSPVKGVIVDRRVNIGQTVVSSLNAPSLFLLAKDLTRMQVWASVNEADIGQIHAGQPVTFTVDAYPGQVFKGTVGKVRLNATMTQNVVTYTVEVIIDNSDGKLLPYLTANVQFEVATHRDVLLVPNAALRWTPPPAMIAPDARENPQRRKAPAAADTGSKAKPERGIVWVEAGEYLRPISVRIGLTDNTVTEVQSDELADSTEIVVGELHQNDGNATTNPFTPQMFGKKPQQ